jgi:peptidoglycan/xylan/chitin deacetylase (PgdA/CDA1 family)
MKNCITLNLTALFLFLFHSSCFSAVILQYHHVSNTTPKSTSITPAQFEVHLKYLKEHKFNVIPLSQIVEKIKKQQPLKDKTVAITFDDAYISIFTQAKPLLDKFNYPYTIFVNPSTIFPDSPSSLSWKQLKLLADEGVIIANHGFDHHSMTRIPNNLTETQWLTTQKKSLLKAEAMIKKETGKSWQYYAYPYGEYSPAAQNWAKDNGFTAFSQQSGAVGLNTDLTSVPRFPASMPYDEISALRDKLNSLPFNIKLQGRNAETIFEYKQATSITFTIESNDFYKSDLSCYISGLGKQKIQWQGDNSFTIDFNDNLPVGRVRCNCTAASISKPDRFYWYSKPWFILKKGGEWFEL